MSERVLTQVADRTRAKRGKRGGDREKEERK